MLGLCAISILLAFDLTYAITVLKLNNTCNGSQTNMGCFKLPGDLGYEITCPKHNLSEKININFKRFSKSLLVDVSCENLDPKNYCLLSSVETKRSGITKLRFENCPVDKDTILMDVVNKLGFEQITILELKNIEVVQQLAKQQLSGLTDLKSLFIESKNLNEIPQNFFASMQSLESLVLKSTVIIEPYTFMPLTNLINLEISQSAIRDLSKETFQGLEKAEFLYLLNNSITELQSDAFANIKSLTRLDLSGNELTELDANIFAPLAHLSEIILSGNNFSMLPEHLFKHNLQLQYVLFQDNKRSLPILPSGLFSNLPMLENVTLGTDLHEVPRDLFTNSTGLRIITISNNTLLTIPENTFSTQFNLMQLDLTNNELEYLPEQAFAGLHNLMVLELQKNKLTEISRNIFEPLKKLEVLCFGNNRLKFIDPQAFAFTENLRHIGMESNQLSFHTESTPFQHLTKLKVLNLRNNSINKIHFDWKIQLPRLELLDLSHNKITKLRSADLLYLAVNDLLVNLTKNRIDSINFDEIDFLTYSLRQRKVEISLNRNPINCNCDLLKFILFSQHEIGQKVALHLKTNIKQLYCAEPAALRGKLVSDIQPKDLLCVLPTISSGPKEKTCPDGCECFVRKFDEMLIINCNNRHLDEVPELPSAAHLNLTGTELYIEQNNITILPHNSTSGYKDITKLFMARNDLFKINDFNIPNGLTHFDVRYNHVCKISNNVLNIFNSSRLISLKLSHNPWECNCESISLLQFVHRNRQIDDFKEMRCHMSPFDRVALQDLTVNDICPEDKGPLIALAIAISLVGFTIGLIAALYYKYQQEIKVWLYAHNLCLWFVTEEELDKDKKFDAFISYSHCDETFVNNYLLAELESGPLPYKLCIHYRDWLVGDWVQDSIIRSVQESRRTIVVLSENFIKSVWTRMEFRTAHQGALEEKRPRVIVIIYGEIGDIENLDPLLKVYLKMNTYLKWGEPNFWNKLRYAMPHGNKKLRNELINQKQHKLLHNHCRVIFNENDKLEIVDANGMNKNVFL